MRLPRCRSAVLCTLLCANLVMAAVIDPRLFRRDDQSTTTAAAATTGTTSDTASDSSAAASSSSAYPASTSSSVAATTSSSASASASTTAASTIAANSSTTLTSAQASATVISATSSLNLTNYNTTAAGQLPIQPQITPGWGVGGIIMLLTGIVYALIGIKKRWLHVCFSSAFLTSLGTAVLIVYVMSPPVSNAIQGAYVVAVVCSGVIFGGVALVFQDITEGMACMLGGFCLSMWLLCLRAGGLLPDNTSKIIFIVAFTVGVFAFYCTHWTRQYALIACISFSGATVTVLGIDAFSRAGLKEFWAYIWNLNDNLFPLGTDTYPLTRGIRVELAVTIIIFLAGIVSQLKLWRVVQERRAKRDAARAEEELALKREEEERGRQLEEKNARERKEWEAIYGSGDATVTESTAGTDSGVGELDNEKTTRSVLDGEDGQSTRPSRSASQAEKDEAADGESIELKDIKAQPSAAAMVLGQDAEGGAITVRVAEDDHPEGEGAPAETAEVEGAVPQTESATENATEKMAEGAAKEPQSTIRQVPREKEPEIVPLPFKVPDEEEAAARDDDERSSVATFADDDKNMASPTKRSLAKRLSQGSADLLHSLSQRSKRVSIALSRDSDGGEQGDSQEELVATHIKHRDDTSSLAATVDGISSVDEFSMQDEQEAEDAEQAPREIEVQAQLSDHVPAIHVTEMPETPETVAEAVTETVLQTPAENEPAEPLVAPSRQSPSVASADSTPASLTKDRLPASLSRVALSYRTNEWAKHLSLAETPEPELLQVASETAQPQTQTQMQTPVSTSEAETPALVPTRNMPHDNERPRSVNVEELQQTAETGTPAPAAPRASMATPSRSTSYHSLHDVPPAMRNSVAGGLRSASAGHLVRRTSALRNVPIVEENDGSSGSLSTPGLTAHAGPQTLIGRRESLLRSKSQQGFYIGGPLTQRAEAMGSRVSLGPTANLGGVHGNMSMPAIPSSGASDSTGSVYEGAPAVGADLDDLPLSKRREMMMRQQSYAAMTGGGAAGSPSPSPSPASPTVGGAMAFDSHQPKRGQQHLPKPAVREAQLAAFRSSVAVDLRTSVLGQAGGPSLRESVSVPILQAQRNYMLGQREAEAQRRETERQEKARVERVFDERMRRGQMLDAHRDAMRRMQAAARKI